MKLQFKIQQYQTDAVDSVVRVFEGQPANGMLDYKMDEGKMYVEYEGKMWEVASIGKDFSLTGYRNADVTLEDKSLLMNIRSVQSQNNIHLSNHLVNNLGRCQLDVEMETGTGKTYVYIKTMFELNKHYGWTKFIVVVPSIAIREGVKKSFDITSDHFMELYGKRARYFIYNSDNLSQIDSYSQSADINVMIINTQAFNTSLKEGASNKAARIIYDKRDEFGSRKPIDVIAANRPIVIMDEPQKMGGAATKAALEKFQPLFTLNYSATHKESHNPVYVLDALDAYNQKLVKQIEVVGFELRNLKGTDGYLLLEEIVLSKDKAPRVRLEFEQQLKSGGIKRVSKLFSVGDSIYHASGELGQYEGITVSDIIVDPYRSERSKVVFTNGLEMHIKDIVGNVEADHKIRVQIRETIAAHFRKEHSLFHRGIKCLSLFFLDEVKNYRQYDQEGNQVLGRYGEIFEQEYLAALNEAQNIFDPDYMAYLSSIAVGRTHAGYFSIDKKGHAIDSAVKRGTDMSDDISAYDLILKNKERLLSLDEPVRFIFSHSALREGWDNPNVFQICSLRQSGSVSQKRQEVGRGLRLCVDSHGVRQDSDTLQEMVHHINVLTVVASEGYASFAADLQKDIRADLYDRPTRADVDFFLGKVVRNANGESLNIDKKDAQEIYFELRMNKYIDGDGNVTDTFREDLANDKLHLLSDSKLEPYSHDVYRLVRGIYDPSALNSLIKDGSKPKTPDNKLNDNFYKAEFQELWKRINHKYAYVVDFDSEELVDKAYTHINAELHVSRLRYVVTTGRQKDSVTLREVKEGEMMQQTGSTHQVLSTDLVSQVKYDLLGKIASATRLTRRTVAAILSKISAEKFGMFRSNPEEFISQVSRIIREQKATVIVNHITYNQIEGSYDSSIFTQEKHTDYDRAYEGKKSVMDYVFTDGMAEKSVERKFVESLDTAKEVCVYAKLPRGFHIPTPVGNYSPDWAIAFQEGAVKHIYFVAETKGSMSSLDLREIEKGKIACAEKLFEQLSTADIRCGRVNSFETLMSLVQ